MPHCSIEYSANLDGRADMSGLCAALSQAILSTGLFEIGAVRVRALACAAYAIADQHPDNAFVDISFRIGRGRTGEEKKRTGEVMFAAAGDHLAHLFDTPHFALSLEIREIDAELSWKKNAIHPRLRGQ
ncbi:5-carboxymethyl-2-hydroxymuconate Delta-isomerase [Labrys wisconsinensis]|uniref:5-carboxymethyl-2-hydroxymuconate isomerase n=1 Tax=Labrys wisconsinensis TaxID=425677 RepID=A0ABU0JBY7_9HYPH|nr:5-carboxymethyl-2-hydroxymuconate Delta-isomerase [Labrys wisconsinensis]MDQ0471792.1 5-carboxymethyl-2-hydroxymuconate isomerase [Labrys wisconsinensis]